MMKKLGWFSCGAASAVAVKLTDAWPVYCDTGSEHPDNKRFMEDCRIWFGRSSITVLHSDEYKDTWDVWEKTRWKAIAEPVTREFWTETVGPKYMTAAEGRMDGGKREGNGAMDGTRNKRSVWEIASQPFSGAHFATFPPALIEPCILAGCPKGGIVLDPFGGAGTTGMVADRLGRDAILVELNQQYAEMAERRIHDDAGMFAQTDVQ